jgi:RNA polymerase sigma-70 factor (ECF subfamily)
MVAAAVMEELGFAYPQVMEVRQAPAPRPEAALARAAARGDRAAFAELVDLHKRSVFGLAVRLLRDAEEARDAAQETFVWAYAAIGTYDVAQPFAPWLLRIARNHCLDQLRRRLPAASQVALDAEAEDGEPARQLPDAEARGADEVLERAQTRTALEAAVSALPPNYREVIQLFHVEQLSYKEIAGTLDVPIGTVMTWLHRARGKLRTALLEQGLENQP